MPWVRQFDESEVLEKAMRAFWAHGFEATSLRDLVDCTGLNRGSIYAAFGDKRGGAAIGAGVRVVGKPGGHATPV